jgi:hypothetical protein
VALQGSNDHAGLKWNIAFATSRCVHSWPTGWSRQPIEWPLNPGFTLGDAQGCYSNVTFLPRAVRLVQTTGEIEAAVVEGLVPVMLGDRVLEKRAAVQSLGGYAYLMRECIHCALPKVQGLKKTAGLVVIICVGWSGGSKFDKRQ